ncbi:conserved hypothetical protein [Candidatus Liberibacter solanacearum]
MKTLSSCIINSLTYMKLESIKKDIVQVIFPDQAYTFHLEE